MAHNPCLRDIVCDESHLDNPLGNGQGCGQKQKTGLNKCSVWPPSSVLHDKTMKTPPIHSVKMFSDMSTHHVELHPPARGLYPHLSGTFDHAFQKSTCCFSFLCSSLLPSFSHKVSRKLGQGLLQFYGVLFEVGQNFFCEYYVESQEITRTCRFSKSLRGPKTNKTFREQRNKREPLKNAFLH